MSLEKETTEYAAKTPRSRALYRTHTSLSWKALEGAALSHGCYSC